MKKITFLLAFCAMSFLASAQILLDEKFPDFPTSDMLSTVSANGWTNWVSNSFDTSKNFRTLAAPLSYADVTGVPALSGLGFSVYNDYTGVTGNNYITYKRFVTDSVNTGSIYMSFLWHVYKAGGSQGEVVGLSDSIQRGAVRIWIKQSSSTAFALGLTRSSGSSADIQISTGPTYSFGTTFFVVLKYNFASKTASVFMNPAIGTTTEPTPTVSDDGSKWDPLKLAPIAGRTAMRYLHFRNGGSNKAYYYTSGIRVCTSWSDAVAALQLPKVATPTIGSASAIGTEGFTASWTPTSDAAGYSVLVYNGTTLFSKTDVVGKTTSSTVITGLVSNTTYTFKVQAKGDNVASGNSDPSAASASFTTLDGATSLNPDFSDNTWGSVYPNSTSEPAALSYPSFANGNYFVSNGLNSSSKRIGMFLPTNPTVRDTIKYWIKLDKSTALGGSYLALPSMKQVGSMELHVFSGAPGRAFFIQELATDGSWKTDYSLTTSKDTLNNKDTIMTLNFSNHYGTKLRIVNNGSGYLGVGVVKVSGVISGLVDNTSNISLYSTGKTIVSSQPGQLSIYNMQGMLVYKEAIESRRITSLSSGIYIVRLKASDGSMTTRKVLLQ